MKIIARCAGCGREVQGSAKWAGREGQCPGCGQVVRFSSAPTPDVDPPPFLPLEPRRQTQPAFSSTLRRRLAMAFLFGCTTACLLACVWYLNRRQDHYRPIVAQPSNTQSSLADKSVMQQLSELQERVGKTEIQLSRQREAIINLGWDIDWLRKETARIFGDRWEVVRSPSSQDGARSTIDSDHDARN